VYELHRCRRVQSVFRLAADTIARKQDKYGSKSLAAGSESVLYQFVGFALFEAGGKEFIDAFVDQRSFVVEQLLERVHRLPQSIFLPDE
jgi:hypothetical protein